MDLLQKQVTHKTFGNGVIIEKMNDMITVSFAGEIGKKRFLYPEAFEHFLVIDDPEMKDIIACDLKIKLKENEEERFYKDKLKREAALQRAKELEEKKAASKKKPVAKKTASKAVKKTVPATSKNG